MAAMTATRELLLRWHRGDQAAMAQLVQEEGDFVARQVRARLGPQLRRQHDTGDIVQAMLLQALRSVPRFLVSDRGHLRGLLVRMVENTLRVEAERQQRAKRDVRREQPLAFGPADTVLDLDPVAAATDPAHAAQRAELRDWVRLALELLEPEDREIVRLRDYDQLPFGEIAAQLGLTEDAARMRHKRAMPKLARTLERLSSGRIGELL